MFKLYICKERYNKVTGKTNTRKLMIMNVVEYIWGENRMSKQLFESHPPGLNEIVFEEVADKMCSR